MSFGNDYKAFLNAIELKDLRNCEYIYSQCDCKSFYLEKAIEEFGVETCQKLIESFVSIGLKKSTEKKFEQVKKTVLENSKIKKTSKKVVLVHKKNQMKNKLFHLSGSSFENENISKDDIELALEYTNKKNIA